MTLINMCYDSITFYNYITINDMQKTGPTRSIDPTHNYQNQHGRFYLRFSTHDFPNQSVRSERVSQRRAGKLMGELKVKNQNYCND